jgi:hypothetical protein
MNYLTVSDDIFVCTGVVHIVMQSLPDYAADVSSKTTKKGACKQCRRLKIWQR